MAFECKPYGWIIKVFHLAKLQSTLTSAVEHPNKILVYNFIPSEWNLANRVGQNPLREIIFQSDSLSVVLFVFILNPLSYLFTKRCNQRNETRRISHLIFVDVLKHVWIKYQPHYILYILNLKVVHSAHVHYNKKKKK